MVITGGRSGRADYGVGSNTHRRQFDSRPLAGGGTSLWAGKTCLGRERQAGHDETAGPNLNSAI